MKAVVYEQYGPPEVLQIRTVSTPSPADNEILIRVYATTVTAADFRARSFTVPPAFWLPARISLGLRIPKKAVLGAELAGEVEAAGKNVTRFKPGDPVFAATLQTFGAYAEYKCLPEDAAVALKPGNLTYEQAAALPIGARTALHFSGKRTSSPVRRSWSTALRAASAPTPYSLPGILERMSPGCAAQRMSIW